jgi:hypothetical protein
MNDIKTKFCPKCKVEKSINEFYKRPDCKNGFRYQCKICFNRQTKQYSLENPEKVKQQKKQWEIKNLDETKKRKKKYYIEKIDEIKKQQKQYRTNNPEKIKENNNNFNLKNPDYRKKYYKQWYIKNKIKIDIHKLKYQKDKYKRDINFRISRTCRGMVNRAFNGSIKSEHTMTYFMCTVTEFKLHIEKQWLPGMNWNNRGQGYGKWNIDHIIPCSFFNMVDEVEKYMCCRYQNLQPLWWEDNMKKGFKIIDSY